MYTLLFYTKVVFIVGVVSFNSSCFQKTFNLFLFSVWQVYFIIVIFSKKTIIVIQKTFLALEIFQRKTQTDVKLPINFLID